MGCADGPPRTLDVQAEWRPLSYRFPASPTELAEGAVVCRWWMGEAEIYVGETQSLRSRVRQYLNPGPSQATHQRVAGSLREALKRGMVARLCVLQSLTVNRAAIDIGALGNATFRKQVEECCKTWAISQGYSLLNR